MGEDDAMAADKSMPLIKEEEAAFTVKPNAVEAFSVKPSAEVEAALAACDVRIQQQVDEFYGPMDYDSDDDPDTCYAKMKTWFERGLQAYLAHYPSLLVAKVPDDADAVSSSASSDK